MSESVELELMRAAGAIEVTKGQADLLAKLLKIALRNIGERDDEIAELKESRPEGWVSCEDRLPEEWQEFVMFCNSKTGAWGQAKYWDFGRGLGFYVTDTDGYWHHNIQPTHWCIPFLPVKAGEGRD